MSRYHKNDRMAPSADVRRYNDECAMTEYIWQHYTHLMSGVEVRAGQYAVPIIESSDNQKVRVIHRQLAMQRGSVDETAVLNALRDGRDALRDQVRNRLLKQHPHEVFINRCPACQRIVCSPLARQCLRCKHDWHGTNVEVPIAGR